MQYTIIMRTFKHETGEWIGLQVWSMDDDLESAVHCYSVTFYEWFTQEDKLSTEKELYAIYGIEHE